MRTVVPQEAESREERILILAPLRRDGPAVAKVISGAGMIPHLCETVDELCKAIGEGAGALLIAEEALSRPKQVSALANFLKSQPPWSDLSVLLVTANGRAPAKSAETRIGGYENVILLERPLRSGPLVSTLGASLRARRRQYQFREHLLARMHQEEELRRLKDSLEQRVQERTRDLEEEMRRREEAEKALRQSQKVEAIGQLTGGLAHDFNNLLQVIKAGLDMLDRTTDPDRHERLMDGMRQAAERGQALVGQLLAFARRMTLTPEVLDLRALLDGMNILVSGAVRENIAINFDLEDDLWPVFADRTQLELALLNLAVNARDAMPSGGTLSIRARNAREEASEDGNLTGDFVRIEVEDTGSGISPEHIERVFDPFFTTKPVGKGTGLGLSQVFGFATQSGGTVSVRSEPGQGTTIALLLPKALPEGSSARNAAAIQSVRPVANGDRYVLLVEDNDQVADLATQMLECLGLKVQRASTAKDALKKLENGTNFDLVFSDVVMPGGMSGIDLAHELKKRTPQMPVLLTTGYANPSAGHAPPEGSIIIKKPYGLQELETAIRGLQAE